ncbi:MAG: gamma carbonic anhydrase family protein [Endozoicomonas sp. (ex Botrylloides leachii)]|nr:gamma carbonic anhydrase family protein [Endozoicomonas sp. (ex Botrylloides leachii)]
MATKAEGFRGKYPYISESAYIAASATIIGDVHIGDDCSVWPTAVIRGDTNAIQIGAKTSIQDGSVLHVTHKNDNNPAGYPLTIGQEVTVGHKAVLHGCIIGNRCLIGIGAMVLDGAVIENDIIIAAGCLVPPKKKLTSGYVYKGSPAKKSRPLTTEEYQLLRYNAAHYVGLKNEYLKSCYS